MDLAHIQQTISRFSSTVHCDEHPDPNPTLQKQIDRKLTLDALDILACLCELAMNEKVVTRKWYTARIQDIAGRALDGEPAAAKALKMIEPDLNLTVNV